MAPEPEEPGRLGPLPRTVLAAWAVVALALGWLLHPVADRLGTAPVVTWPQPVALVFVVAFVGWTAWSTWRAVQVRHDRLPAHQGLNRLVLARACAYVGALAAGGYLGYALSFVGDAAELAEQRVVRSLVAAAAGGLLVVVSLLLERACRVRDDEPDL